MNRTTNRLMAVGIAFLSLFAACQKEPIGCLELVAEGMGGGNPKMTVNGTEAYWQTGDSVNINGDIMYLTTTSERAYINGSFSDEEYCIVFPGGLLQGRSGSTVSLDMPAVYQYRSQYSYGIGTRQVLDAPLAYLGDANGGNVLLRHLTGALDVMITGPSGIEIDRIVISTTQNRVLSGPMEFDLSDWTHMGTNATNATAHNTIEMRFDNISFSTGTVQIPVPAQKSLVNFTVKVEGHVEGTKYTFERTQNAGGYLLRGKKGTVVVDLNEGQPGVTTSALFPTTVVGGKTYYQISTPEDLCLMSNAVCGTHYREDGDDYTRRWSYNGLYYKDANYILVNDIDMTNRLFSGIEGFDGELNGGNHSIMNLTVSGNSDASYPVCWGLFSSTSYGSSVLVENLQISNITLVSRNSIDYPAYCGSLFGNAGGEVTISNVEITGYKIVRNTSYSGGYGNFYTGGFIGRQSGNVTIENSSASFDDNQAFAEWDNYMLYCGGITAYYQITDAETSLYNVNVNFGAMNFSPWARRSFGGIGAVNYTDSKVSAEGTTLTGTISFSSGDNTANKISPYIGSKEGVDADELTIILN